LLESTPALHTAPLESGKTESGKAKKRWRTARLAITPPVSPGECPEDHLFACPVFRFLAFPSLSYATTGYIPRPPGWEEMAAQGRAIMSQRKDEQE
jgi:hypothetical protein